MNTINVKVNFTQGTCEVSGINLVTGDYNSTKMIFTFDRENGTKVFEMKSPSEELAMVQQIIGNEIELYGLKDVTTTHNNKTYTEYTKNNAIYWYQETDNKLFDSTWTEVVTFDLTDYELVQEKASLFTEEGYYVFEVSLYEDDSKLTSAKGKIKVKAEQVQIDSEMVEYYLPIFDQMLSELDTATTQANNLNIAVNKSGAIATITLTKKDGTTTVTPIFDGQNGKSIEYDWDNTKLGIRQEGEQDYEYVDLKGDKGDAGAIKMIIVAELPETGADDTIYLVPITPDVSGNNYAEYVYINGAWELLGKIGVQVDLTDYVKFTDYASTTKSGTIKMNNGYATGVVASSGDLFAQTWAYSSYPSMSGNAFIGKGTLENVITGKGLVSNTNYANADTGGVFKSGWYNLAMDGSGHPYVSTRTYAQYTSDGNSVFIGKGTLENVLTEKIGNIQTLLDNLDSGNGV